MRPSSIVPATSTSTILALGLALGLAFGLSGCFDDPVPMSSTSVSETGDGDGDPSGDGDGDLSGDGDPATGDGDGDLSGDGDGDATTTEGGACELSCIPDPGPAWVGPIAVGEDSCADPYPEQVESLFADIDPGQPSCECACGDPQVTCSTNMSVIGYAANNCADGQGANNINPNQCYNTFSASHGLSLASPNASCGAGVVDENIPEPTFAVSRLGCGPGEFVEGSCEPGALCAPDPDGFDGGVCFWSEGDVGCPAGYPNKSLYVTGFDDTRACDESCSCSASGAQCRVSVTGFANDNCISAQGAIPVNSGEEECVAVSQVVQSIRPGSVNVIDEGTCSPGNVGTSGEVSETGQLTVCCSG